ncbi:hypothetical protein, partial [Dactylosporangium sp. NPDC050588]|uniref:hypothetical protein n=1 Tax=Dactylosporangium sp. NPDC050588 TaxID=3157211 RepID=UPI0033C9B9D3
MITLILVMLRTRRGQAVTLAVLSLLAVGAAVAVPAYLAAVDAAVVRGEVAAAEAGERTVSLNATVDSGEGLGRVQFADVGNTLLDLPGFTHVYSARFPAVGIEPGPREASWITYRQHVCAHVTVVAGRCLIGSGEVLLGEQSARRLRLRAGDEVTVTYAVSNPDPEGRAPAYTADGAPVRMVVVGVYRVPAPRDEYWGGHDYFALDAFGRAAEPVFTDAATFELMHPAMSNVSFDATADASVFDPAGGAALRDRLARLKDDTARLGAGFGVTTRIPDLVDRIDRSRDLARQTVPVGAVPLVLLAYLALYLAVDYGAEGRRTELAVVALRGTRWWHRWTLALGESVAAIAAGAVAGYAAGQLAIGGFVAWRFPGLGLPLLDAGALWPAVTAALGAVLVAALAQRRHLLSPVSDLLRRVRRRAPGFPVGEVVLGALAAAAVGQLFATGGRLSGVGMLAPALSILTLAAAGARLLGPAAAAVGRAALARGRVGTALAALHLGRRPAAHRILLLLVTATAVLGYAVSGADVAGQDRDLAARITTGAPRVVTVVPVSRQQLLYAVRSADPDGRFAMAVAHVPGGAPGEPPKLAVDSARLPSVVEWLPEYGDLDANRIAQVLHPPARPPIVVTGQEITIDIDVSGARAEEPVRLFAVLASLTGRGTTSAAAGVLADGPYTVRVRTSVCADGCRLVALRLAPDRQTATGITVGVTLRGLGGTSSTPGVTSPAPGGASPVPGPEPGGASPAPGAGPGGARPHRHHRHRRLRQNHPHHQRLPHP